MQIIFDLPGSPEIHLDVLNAICGEDRESMIDLCCCEGNSTRYLGFQNELFVDIQRWPIWERDPRFIQVDVRDLYPALKFSTSFLLDAVEHFNIHDAIQLLGKMEDLSKKQIVFTPLGDYLLEKEPTNNPDSHKTGWTPKQFEDMGWATIVFPNYHELLAIGAFYAFKQIGITDDFERVKNTLINKSWAK